MTNPFAWSPGTPHAHSHNLYDLTRALAWLQRLVEWEDKHGDGMSMTPEELEEEKKMLVIWMSEARHITTGEE